MHKHPLKTNFNRLFIPLCKPLTLPTRQASGSTCRPRRNSHTHTHTTSAINVLKNALHVAFYTLVQVRWLFHGSRWEVGHCWKDLSANRPVSNRTNSIVLRCVSPHETAWRSEGSCRKRPHNWTFDCACPSFAFYPLTRPVSGTTSQLICYVCYIDHDNNSIITK